MIPPSATCHSLLAIKSIAFIVLLSAAPFAASGEDATPRDPFWPVDYNAPKPEKMADETVAPAEADFIWPDLSIKGISRGRDGEYLALIEGIGIIRAGEDISIQNENVWFHWRVSSINAKGLRTIKLGISKDRNPPSYNPASEKAP